MWMGCLLAPVRISSDRWMVFFVGDPLASFTRPIVTMAAIFFTVGRRPETLGEARSWQDADECGIMDKGEWRNVYEPVRGPRYAM